MDRGQDGRELKFLSIMISRKVISNVEALIYRADEIISDANKQSKLVDTKQVNSIKANAWCTSCKAFISSIFGRDSEYMKAFVRGEPDSFHLYQFLMELEIVKSILRDCNDGLIFDLEKRVRAETFDEFLEQAEYLLSEGFFGVAIVTAGAVLEDTLRKLCEANGITLSDKPKLDKINADLVKAGVYDVLTQKKITVLADLRNKAAHGKWDEIKKVDAEDMLRGTRRFVEDYAA